MAKKGHFTYSPIALIIPIIIATITIVGVVFYIQYTTHTSSKAAPIPLDKQVLPTATAGESACQTISNTLSALSPLRVSPMGTSYNWGNIMEKWFQDSKGQQYYIYPDLSGTNGMPPCEPNHENPNCTLDKAGAIRYVVEQWNKGLQKGGIMPATTDTNTDTPLAFESKSCYDAIAIGFSFPKPVITQTAATCTGDGTTCTYATSCQPCTGQVCPAIMCNRLSGTCQNGRCIPPIPPVTSIACQDIGIALANVAPLKTSANIALNWGGLSEKWFQDKNSQWYYIFPPSDPLVFAGQNGIAKSQIQRYAVMKWNSTTGLQINGRLTQSDIPVTMTNQSCYDAVVPSYTFPLSTATPTPAPVCTHIVSTLAAQGATPLRVVSNNTYLNWGGLNEKWFQDSKNRWYYIYAFTEQSKNSDGTVTQIQSVAVRRWNSGLQKMSSKMVPDFSKDPIVQPETMDCYNAISPTFVFPSN